MFKIANREEAEVDKRYEKVSLKHQAKIKRAKELAFAPAPITITLDTSPEPIDYSIVTDSAHLVLRKPIYTYVEQQPEFPGGEAAMKKFLAKNIKLTPEAVANNIHGEMIVYFIVDDDGTVRFPEVFKELGYGLDEEVLRVIGLFPKFKPGHQNKKNVVVRLRLPIQL